MLVDSGASAHFVDSDLLPGLRDCLMSYQVLDPPMIITTAGLRRVHGTATGELPCIVVDTDGLERRISVRVTVVPGMGKHLFSPKFAQRNGVHTLFTSKNYIDAVHFKVGLRALLKRWTIWICVLFVAYPSGALSLANRACATTWFLPHRP